MDTGTKISAAGHALLLGWLLVGPIFRSEPLPMRVQDVAVISSEDFAALQASREAPSAVTDVAQPEAAAPDPEAPETPEVEAAPEISARPPAATAPASDSVPDVPTSDPAPQTDVAADAPTVEPPSEDVAVLTPDVSSRPVPQQADRVAPQPVVRPDPEAAPDRIEQESVSPDSTGEEAREPQDATAPPETTTAIVTEADRPAAPATSPRPPTNRPDRPVRAAETRPEPQAQPEDRQETPPETEPTDALAAAVADAVAEAQSDRPQPASEPARPAAPAGPPLSGSELEGLRVAVGSCWNVGTLSTEAQGTTVTVYVAMNENGTPRSESIRMLSSSGGGEAAARKVFDTARRAILRCGQDGFPLPVEKYGQWREIEMTFNPEGMFWR